MNKKETSAEYLYQRIDGTITKWERIGYGTYINVKTGITVIRYEFLFTGKTSKNLIDLIEEGDIVNDKRIIMSAKKSQEFYNSEDVFITAKGYTFAEDEIRTVLTHEQYEKNCFYA